MLQKQQEANLKKKNVIYKEEEQVENPAKPKGAAEIAKSRQIHNIEALQESAEKGYHFNAQA